MRGIAMKFHCMPATRKSENPFENDPLFLEVMAE